MTRQTRHPLSAEERRLWTEVLRSVRPLPGRAPPAAADPVPNVPEAPPPPSPPPSPKPLRLRNAPAPEPPRPPPLAPPLAPLERRTVRALARGRAQADATLDLHGMTQVEAHGRLLGFLRRAQGSGHSLVLVITGRGAPASGGGERGILRRVVPHWLSLPELRPLVLGFEEAGTRQGGSGALYVRLRRNRAHGRG